MDNFPDGNELSDIIGKLLADDNFGKILETVKGSFSADAENETAVEPVTEESSSVEEGSPTSAIPALSPELISKLPAIMSMLSQSGSDGSKSHSKMDDRKKLLCALKPFLSHRRRDAVDSIVNIAGITDLFGI